jgi:7-cyano-7-deazaguanine synthase
MRMESPKAKKVGVLFSGGLDSGALIGQYLRDDYEVYPVYITGGLAWEKTELSFAKKFLEAIYSPKLHPPLIIKLHLGDAYQSNWSKTGKIPTAKSSDSAVYLPARNLTLLTRAALFLAPLGVSEIALATLKGNPFPDGKPEYFKLLSKVLSLSFRKPFKISSPFRKLSKADIIEQNASLPLELTFSCINPIGQMHCGGCNKCAERKRAFRQAGVPDQTFYKN